MTNYARIISNVAVDVSADPENSFHPDLAAEFVEVSAKVRHGWIKTGSSWSAPEPAPTPDPVVIPPKVSPIEFRLLFTPAERVAINTAKTDDAVLTDFFSIVDDPRLTFVDLGLQSTQDAIAYLVAKELLTQERASEVLTGTFK